MSTIQVEIFDAEDKKKTRETHRFATSLRLPLVAVVSSAVAKIAFEIPIHQFT